MFSVLLRLLERCFADWRGVFVAVVVVDRAVVGRNSPLQLPQLTAWHSGTY